MFGGSRGGYSGYLRFAGEASDVWSAEEDDEEREGGKGMSFELGSALALALAMALALARAIDDARIIKRREKCLMHEVVIFVAVEHSIAFASKFSWC